MSLKPLRELAEVLMQKEIQKVANFIDDKMPALLWELRFKTDSGRMYSIFEILNSMRYSTVDTTGNFQELRERMIKKYEDEIMWEALVQVQKKNMEMRFPKEEV